MMRRNVCVYAVLAALGLLLRTESAFAQPKEEPKPVEGQLTVLELKAILEGMGYDEVNEIKNKEDRIVGYGVKQIAGTWTFYANFTLSTDKSDIWIVITLAKIPDPGSVPSKVLLKMLEVNDATWPSYFKYLEGTNCFYLDSPVPNRGVKAKTLRARFETMCKHCQTHEAMWNPAKWEIKKKSEDGKKPDEKKPDEK